MKKIDSLIFDIDGTLVDVSQSYREAIRKTASDFMGREVSKAEVDQIKSRPGLNNDWDATYALVSTMTTPPSFESVKDRFQQYYLGGLINKERLLVTATLLDKLKKTYRLGIVTGRPRAEAMLILKKLRIISFFEPAAIICMEDTPLGKPDPSPLLLCQTRLKSKKPVYIGDSVNDELASSSAKISFIPAPILINKLTPPVIQDQGSKQVLMLGYITLEAFLNTLSSGWVYFWSRSRKRLWLKGETSGNRLKVYKIFFDCDQDTVLIKAKLLGNCVCHLGRKSCFKPYDY